MTFWTTVCCDDNLFLKDAADEINDKMLMDMMKDKKRR